MSIVPVSKALELITELPTEQAIKKLTALAAMDDMLPRISSRHFFGEIEPAVDVESEDIFVEDLYEDPKTQNAVVLTRVPAKVKHQCPLEIDETVEVEKDGVKTTEEQKNKYAAISTELFDFIKGLKLADGTSMFFIQTKTSGGSGRETGEIEMLSLAAGNESIQEDIRNMYACNKRINEFFGGKTKVAIYKRSPESLEKAKKAAAEKNKSTTGAKSDPTVVAE